MLDYKQVKERVNRESEQLKKIVIETGILMIAGILIAVFVFR